MEPLKYDNPRLLLEPDKITTGKLSWRSPSNLALIKYWGKYGMQLPRNPSISFTLEHAYTETTIEYSARELVASSDSDHLDLSFFFDNALNEPFEKKVRKFLEQLSGIFPFLSQLKLIIRSKNSFPHSSGIASSASSMSALALCLCSMEDEFFGSLPDDEAFRQKVSYIARLGSGSACRSIFPVMSVWGETGEVSGSSNEFAVPYESFVHQEFKNFHDDILIVSKGSKAVSSRAGHALMDENIYADSRYRQARQRFHNLLRALSSGDIETFGEITESEALTLHALMMTSAPPYILMKPNTLLLIEKVQRFRKEQKIPLYFSLDAGPNLHLLYPDSVATEVKYFTQEELLLYCEDKQWIADRVSADGPVEL